MASGREADACFRHPLGCRLIRHFEVHYAPAFMSRDGRLLPRLGFSEDFEEQRFEPQLRRAIIQLLPEPFIQAGVK